MSNPTSVDLTFLGAAGTVTGLAIASELGWRLIAADGVTVPLSHATSTVP